MASPVVQSKRLEDRAPVDVIVVSPNAHLRQALQEKLSPRRWNVLTSGSGASALEVLRNRAGEASLLLLDPAIPDLEPNGFRSIVQSRFPLTQIMMLNSQTGQLLVGGASPTAISTKLADELNEQLPVNPAIQRPETASLSRLVPERDTPNLRGMIGRSEAMRRIWAMTRMVAARNSTVLITGESGTGKDLLAQEIHLISPRRNQPFVVVNCSAIPETLLEAELFGFTKGSFTGAVQSRIGRIQSAHGGSLFLDELGDMPVSLQSKLLRFLEQGEVQRLGGNENLKVDVRVIAATNADIKRRISEQQFREDLYYRLSVFPIHLPPLRDRMDDIGELALSFAAKFMPGSILTEEAIQILRQHHWPGNVRELRNVIERATILMGTGHEIKAEHILI